MIGTKRFDESALALRDKDGLPVGAAEGEVWRVRRGELDFPLQHSLRRQFGDGALHYPRHKQIAVRVGAQAVDVEISESFDQSRRQQPCAVDPVSPDFPRIGLAYIKRL